MEVGLTSEITNLISRSGIPTPCRGMVEQQEQEGLPGCAITVSCLVIVQETAAGRQWPGRHKQLLQHKRGGTAGIGVLRDGTREH